MNVPPTSPIPSRSPHPHRTQSNALPVLSLLHSSLRTKAPWWAASVSSTTYTTSRRHLASEPNECRSQGGSQRDNAADSCDYVSMGSCSNLGFSQRNNRWCLLSIRRDTLADNDDDDNMSRNATSSSSSSSGSSTSWVCCGVSFEECCDPNPVGIAMGVGFFVLVVFLLALVLRRRARRLDGTFSTTAGGVCSCFFRRPLSIQRPQLRESLPSQQDGTIQRSETAATEHSLDARCITTISTTAATESSSTIVVRNCVEESRRSSATSPQSVP